MIVLADTNIAYLIYFFSKEGVLPSNNIVLSDGIPLKFHPIVDEEVNKHYERWLLKNEIGGNIKKIPPFFDQVGKDEILKIMEFVENNMKEDFSLVDNGDRRFNRNKKLYVKKKEDLQNEWRKNGVKGERVTSTPVKNDYKVLFFAHSLNYRLATNDGILYHIAKEFMSDKDVMLAEDIINDFYKEDPTKKENINSVSSLLDSLGITFQISKALKD